MSTTTAPNPSLSAEAGQPAYSAAASAYAGVLFDQDPGASSEEREQPDFFRDLNLDQIVAVLVLGRSEYQLEQFLRAPLATPEAIGFRHEVMRDLEQPAVHNAISSFASAMQQVRGRISQAGERRYPRQQQRWILDAALLYVGAVRLLSESLQTVPLASRGLMRVRRYLSDYVSGNIFNRLAEEAGGIQDDLAAVHYSLHIGDGSIRVRRFDGRADYSAQVLDHFARFRQGAVKLDLKEIRTSPDMNHIEAAVLDMVAQLYPELFARLDAFSRDRADFIDPAVARFDREIQFYMAFRDYRAPFEAAGLRFCYPEVVRDKAIRSIGGYDLALAHKLVSEAKPVVCNDFRLDGAERIFVVSGPNQGGKTTFARTFGQLHFLACLGLPVPGSEARLMLFDRLFTHFEREEDIRNRRGKLQDDLVRIHAILEDATSESIIIMNEIFTSTALEDALFLSREVLVRIMALDAVAVCVTFIDELSTLGPQTVSVMSAVVSDNPAERTFRIERRPADGKAHALAIARKYRLTFDDLNKRLGS